MNQKLFNVFLFATGAAIGSLVTWKVLKTKYEQTLQDEIDSFKEDYALCMRESSSKYNVSEESVDEIDEDEDDDPDDSDDSNAIEYHKLSQKYRTGDEAENDGKGVGDYEVPYINGPYVISPEEFGDGNYDHSLYCLTYYADGVLSNDWYERLDIDETIGEDSLEHFGDYTEDVVHVRNERTGADYEVAKDPRNYADVVADDPLMAMYAN